MGVLGFDDTQPTTFSGYPRMKVRKGERWELALAFVGRKRPSTKVVLPPKYIYSTLTGLLQLRVWTWNDNCMCGHVDGLTCASVIPRSSTLKENTLYWCGSYLAGRSGMLPATSVRETLGPVMTAGLTGTHEEFACEGWWDSKRNQGDRRKVVAMYDLPWTQYRRIINIKYILKMASFKKLSSIIDEWFFNNNLTSYLK